MLRKTGRYVLVVGEGNDSFSGVQGQYNQTTFLNLKAGGSIGSFWRCARCPAPDICHNLRARTHSESGAFRFHQGPNELFEV